MNKTKTRIITSNAEIDAAVAQAIVYDEVRPRALAAEYRQADDVIVIRLATGVEIVIPRRLLQGLETADAHTTADMQIDDHGSVLHWESLDLDHYVPGLIAGVFGNRRWMSEIGKRGGLKRSPAKVKAARANGRKGGRPAKSAGK